MAPHPGYRRIPGSAERYTRLQDGAELSRRQYENERFRLAGWSNWSEYQRHAQNDQFQRWVVAERQSSGGSYRSIVHPTSQFSRDYAAALRSGWSKSASGPFARLLANLGLRPQNATWEVGQTPKA